MMMTQVRTLVTSWILGKDKERAKFVPAAFINLCCKFNNSATGSLEVVNYYSRVHDHVHTLELTCFFADSFTATYTQGDRHTW